LGDLPDINAWIALLNAQHPHHRAAKAYWENAASARIAFCRVTMMGLLRLSTNKAVMGGAPYTTQEAWQAYQAVVALPEVQFLAEPAGIDGLMQTLTTSASFRSADWTDAYLAAFAQLSNQRMVSFDKGFTNYNGLALLTL
jgi:toxin-antitoxin system PIN domain toxin